MYDLFFVSYEEPNANDNWKRLKARFPHARHIHGIKGIGNAHRACAIESYTKMFWTVDADTVSDSSWDFSYQPPSWDMDYLHLWYSRNPVNLLSYGYGSIKLWPRARMLAHTGPWIDFTTSVGMIKIMGHTIATTFFNSSPFEAWKSAFRECVKLSENIKRDPSDLESKERLEAWQSIAGNPENGIWCVKGAVDAIKWHEQATDLSLINDFSWLKHTFQQEYEMITRRA